MANYSQLYDSKVKGTPDEDRDRRLASGRYIVPLFWLASASIENVRSGRRDGEKITYLEVPRDAALANFNRRTPALSSIAAGISAHFDGWLSLLTKATNSYLKIDPTEILDMVGTDPKEISLAISFFDKPSEPSLKALLSLTCLTDVIEGSPPHLQNKARVGGVESLTPSSEYLIGTE